MQQDSRAWGQQLFRAAEMEEFRAVEPLHASQPPLNLFERAAQRDVVPYCRKHDIAVLVWSALCRSLLTGKIRPDHTFPADDIRFAGPKFQPPRPAELWQACSAFGIALARSAGSFCGAVGCKRPAQMLPVEEIFGWKMTAEDMLAVDCIVRDYVQDPVGPEYLEPTLRE
jgi:aryl-alcohol dehydrogenase-like predicted oxidoreductase